MPLLLALLALFTPRIAIVVLWLFGRHLAIRLSDA